VPAGLTLLLVGFLIGVGVLFAWRRAGHGSAGGGPRVIAVLPFENQGDSTQEYFADGITDEVRGKLSALPGLQVIASGSMREYKHTPKPLTQVAKELGADYLLLARVRWAKNPDGSSQVRVNPELVAVTAGKPVTRWQQPFDAALTNVFQVQAEIAEKVAGALDLALADSVSRQLAEQPTANLPAYDAYLRGTQLFVAQGRSDLPGLRQASTYFKQALALDSSFAPAWAQLSRAQGLLYSNGVPDPALDSASRRAAERAVALAPRLAAAHLALGAYYVNVRGDLARARREFETALRLAPNNATVLRSMALIEHAAGQFDSALAFARQSKQVDPRFASGAVRAGWILRSLRRYPEARVEVDRAMALSPTNIGIREDRTLVELGAGDLDSARAIIRNAPPEMEQGTLVAYFGTYWDLFWVLDDTQQRFLLTLTPSEFDNDRAAWGIVLAQTWWLRGDQAKARAYADSARAAFVAHVKANPTDGQQLLLQGLAEAYMGRKAEAIQDGERGTTMALQSNDATTDPYFQHVLARLYILCGEQEKALDLLEHLLKVPYDLSPGWLRIDPNFAPLRGNPRFERLVKGT
jgi:TolB-like protein/Tfp pilus assembly protein PilF